MNDQYQLRVTLFSPERDVLAQLDVPISDYRGWQIYQEAVGSSLRPDAILTLPPEMTTEDIDEMRRKWKDIPARLIADVGLDDDGESA